MLRGACFSGSIMTSSRSASRRPSWRLAQPAWTPRGAGLDRDRRRRAGARDRAMLARRGYRDVHVYDRLPPPPDPDDSAVWGDTAKFYLIAGGRGQRVAKEPGGGRCRAAPIYVGRKDWPLGAPPEAGVEGKFTDRPYTTAVLPRDRAMASSTAAVSPTTPTPSRSTTAPSASRSREDYRAGGEPRAPARAARPRARGGGHGRGRRRRV